MNWYRTIKISAIIKKSSVTFSLHGSQDVQQPENILDLCHDFTDFCSKNRLYTETFNSSAYNGGVEPDGSDYDKMTGTINVYVPIDRSISPENKSSHDQLQAKMESLHDKYQHAEYGTKEHQMYLSEYNNLYKNIKNLETIVPRGTFNKEEYINAINLWISEKKSLGFNMSVREDVSNMRGGPVFRIQIANNPTEKLEQLPEINMSNDNAISILRLLGFTSEDYSGQITLQDLKQRIIAISQEEMQRETIEPRVVLPEDNIQESDPADFWKGEQDSTQNQKGPTIFMGGRDINYIDTRLQDLYQLVDYGISKGFNSVVWG